jgi:long-chain-fatty-acid--[acyl-carrier-protein] ligase
LAAGYHPAVEGIAMLLLRYVLWLLARLVLWLRYRVRIHGAEQVRGLKGPVLILPNHPSYTDPVLVILVLWPALRPRPLQYEGYFRNPLLYPLMKLQGAVPVPDLERASVEARDRTQQTVNVVIEGLRRGENFILWPAGHIQHDGVERLGGARAAADILRSVPEAEVVLVRSRGLWGSVFSFARTGQRPRLIRNLWLGAGLLLSNLLVFMPRRPVSITVERVDRGRSPKPQREALNPWLNSRTSSPCTSKTTQAAPDRESAARSVLLLEWHRP